MTLRVMRVGFTGTRAGMSAAQRAQLVLVLDWLLDSHLCMGEFHHGDEPHADREAAAAARAVGVGRVVAHPPTTLTARDLLARNRELVAAVDLLIAAPRTDREVLRSGTWATVRYARRRGIPVVMLSRGEEVTMASRSEKRFPLSEGAVLLVKSAAARVWDYIGGDCLRAMEDAGESPVMSRKDVVELVMDASRLEEELRHNKRTAEHPDLQALLTVWADWKHPDWPMASERIHKLVTAAFAYARYGW